MFGRGVNPHYRRGIVAFNREDYDEAIEAFERAIASIPDHSDPYYSLGVFYATEARGKLGLALLRKGEDEGAAQVLAKALEENHDYPDLC